MEEDRAQVDLGVAADIEQLQNAQAVPKQPKKRFVGRRAAAETAAGRNGSGSTNIEDSGSIQGKSRLLRHAHQDLLLTLTRQWHSRGGRPGS